MWGHLKTLVYSGAIQNEGTIHKSIFDGSQTILNCSQDILKCTVLTSSGW
jgi:hypothetical protein